MIEVIEDEQLVEAANRVAATFRARLDTLQEKYPSVIGDIRTSHGAMMAIELVKDGDPEQPDC